MIAFKSLLAVSLFFCVNPESKFLIADVKFSTTFSATSMTKVGPGTSPVDGGQVGKLVGMLVGKLVNKLW